MNGAVSFPSTKAGPANTLEEVLVPPHAVAVAERADLVLKHLLVNSKMGVGVRVVVSRGGRLLRLEKVS